MIKYKEESTKISFVPFVSSSVSSVVKANLSIRLLSIILLSLISLFTFGQEAKLSESIISIAEELAADESDPEAVSLYIEKLYELYENPVRINSATSGEISRLFFLSDFQVKVLAEYIDVTGKIISVYEIANIPGFDKEMALMMTHFINLDEAPIKDTRYSSWRNTLLTNLIWKPGDDDSTYTGSPVRVLTKYKFSSAGFSGGLLAEKDPGETLLSGNPPLPDHLCGHLAYNGKGFIRRIIIGDYSARFGQGTNINTTLQTGLSLHAPGYMSPRNEIRPYNSTDENNFFRGAGAEFSFRNMALSLFYSRNLIDASLSSGSGISNDHIKSFYTSGLHNSSASILKKDAVTDLTYGINLSYNPGNIKIGGIWSEERFSLPVKQNENEPEKIFDFAGNVNSVYSLYYSSLVTRVLLYGEISMNRTKRYALVQGITFRPSDRFSVNMLYRQYDKGYFSFHGKGPGSTSLAGAGKSILGNFMFEAAKYLFISGGCEIQDYLWLRYRTSSPSNSIKREIRIRYLPAEKLLIEGAYNFRLSTVDGDKKNSIPGLTQLTTRTFTSLIRYSLIDNLTLGTRVYYKLAEHSGNRGSVLLQELNYKFRNIPVTLWLRYCLFNTDDWDTRIYTYENDLLYSFSIPSLYGKGSRNYMMVAWRICDKADIRFKYGILSKSLPGNNNSCAEEFRFQLRLFI